MCRVVDVLQAVSGIVAGLQPHVIAGSVFKNMMPRTDQDENEQDKNV